MKIYQVLLKYYRDKEYQEVVMETFDEQEALAAKEQYSKYEDNTNIYYVVQSVDIPMAVKRKVKK